MARVDKERKTPYLDSLQRDGYVVIRNLISAEQVEELRQASEHIARLARNNQWPYVRTVPKQYPPWPQNSAGTNIWGVQHLLHPKMPNRSVFAKLYFGDAVLDVVRQLICLDPTSTSQQQRHKGDLKDKNTKTTNGNTTKTAIMSTTTDDNNTEGTNNHDPNNEEEPKNNDNSTEDETKNANENEDRGEDLVMELFNLLISPLKTSSSSASSTESQNQDQTQNFNLAWHRDDIKPNLTPAEEQIELDLKSFTPPYGRQLHAQYNIALTGNDTSLIIIPGSHRRIRTEIERNASLHYQDALLPGQETVTLNAGDAVFYNSNILHRGVYTHINKTQTGRLTLHGCVGLSGHDGARARQVLQHGVGEWVADYMDDEMDDSDNPPHHHHHHHQVGFGFGLDARLTARAEAMRERLVRMGRGDGLGYSLEG